MLVDVGGILLGHVWCNAKNPPQTMQSQTFMCEHHCECQAHVCFDLIKSELWRIKAIAG